MMPVKVNTNVVHRNNIYASLNEKVFAEER